MEILKIENNHGFILGFDGEFKNVKLMKNEDLKYLRMIIIMNDDITIEQDEAKIKTITDSLEQERYRKRVKDLLELMQASEALRNVFMMNDSDK